MVCSFFGNRNASEHIKSEVEKIIKGLITDEKVDTFYVGNNGNFDGYVKGSLQKLAKKYSSFKYYIVVSSLKKKSTDNTTYLNIIFPEILEKTPHKFAIPVRNKWIIKQSDIVVIYAKNITGGAGDCKAYAEKLNKKIIDISYV